MCEPGVELGDWAGGEVGAVEGAFEVLFGAGVGGGGAGGDWFVVLMLSRRMKERQWIVQMCFALWLLWEAMLVRVRVRWRKEVMRWVFLGGDVEGGIKFWIRVIQ